MLATNDGSKVTDSWTLRHILYSKVGNFLGRELQLIKWSLWPGFPKLSLFNFLTECSCCGGIMRKDLHLLESGPWTLGLIEEHLQLGFITKQKLWTDNQLSIENETIGDKEDMHDWRETFRQNICILPPSALISFKTFSVSFYQNDSRFYLNKLLALVVITGDCNTCRPGFADHSTKTATKPTFYDASRLENKEFKLS